MADSNHCPLLELPAELRNRIWELVLHNTLARPIYIIHATRLPALLHTCRQTRSDIHDLFFSNATFQTNDATVATQVLSALSPKAHRVISEVRYNPYISPDASELDKVVVPGLGQFQVRKRSRASLRLEELRHLNAFDCGLYQAGVRLRHWSIKIRLWETVLQAMQPLRWYCRQAMHYYFTPENGVAAYEFVE